MADTTKALHIPVLPDAVVQYLAPQRGGRFLDGTLGLGGHARLCLNAAHEAHANIEWCGLDRDTDALTHAKETLAEYSDRTHFFHLKYSQFEEALNTLGWSELDGVLLDIGVSSLQLDTPERGFSFRTDAPLDMRMDQSDTSGETTVAFLVNHATREELQNIIATYGEDPQAARIATGIVKARDQHPINTTAELAKIIVEAYPPAWRVKARNHPATRTFQALRMAVNDELTELTGFLSKILAYMKVGGRLVVISFHSLEDRTVKHMMRTWADGCLCPKYLPSCICSHQPEVTILTKHPVTASDDELLLNPRASSAKLRAVEKLALPAEAVPYATLSAKGGYLESQPFFSKDRNKLRDEKQRQRSGGA